MAAADGELIAIRHTIFPEKKREKYRETQGRHQEQSAVNFFPPPLSQRNKQPFPLSKQGQNRRSIISPLFPS